ncbi:MAG TPA: ATP-binding protein [Anaerolineaceae bacterium]|nr:ATP-binding protein [Anaerolineaceae bacterium]
MSSSPERQAFWLLKNINRAIYQHGMFAHGDRIAVALSGGKDSLSLLRLLDFRRKYVLEDYELVAIHVQSDARGPDTPAHQPLISWLEQSGFPYSIEPIRIADDETLPMGCHRCAWNRRHTLFEAAARLGCGVIAFGHHADDLAQTTLLNLLYHGRVETMSPCRDYFEGRLRLVRPLCYTAERDIRRFARANDFPPAPPECPQSNHSRRALIARLLNGIEKDVPCAKANLLRAGLLGSQAIDI